MDSFNFEEFNRQNAIGIIIIFTQSVRRTINAFLAVFAYSVFTNGMNIYTYSTFALVLLIMAISSVLRFQKFRFKVTESQLILNSGVLTKEVTNIPLERIQSVQLHQNFIQRLLNITGIKIDTAGSSGQELEISALKRNKANALVKLLNDKIKSFEPAENDLNEESEEFAVNEKSAAELLVELDFKGLLLLAITENHIRNGLIAVAFVFGYLNQYLDVTEEFLIDAFENFDPGIVESSFVKAVSFLIVFLFVSVLLSFIQVFLKFWNFKAEISEKSFMIKTGLLKRNEYTIPIKKIQFLEWKTNVLRKIPGFESIRIHQGRSVEASAKNQVEIPACYSDQSDRVMDKLFPEHDESVFGLSHPHSFQIRFRAILFSLMLLPAAIALSFSTGHYYIIPLLYLIWVAICIVSSYKYVQSVNLWTNEDLLIYERGWLFQRRTVIKHFKVQTVEIKQSIFQKRRGICHLSFSTAAGSRNIRFFNQNEMEELRDYLLYKIQSHNGSWM